ncbi:PAS domain-containing protein, partial [bacterium]|nr:PAS domain-containing protein [bacterium]
IEDRISLPWKDIRGQRIYLVSDLPISTPLPEGVIGVIPRDSMVVKAIITLFTEMRESYELGDRLIRSLNEKELAVQEKQKTLLRDSRRYKVIIKNATDLIFMLGPSGKIMFSNETMGIYLKDGQESLLGRQVSDFVVLEDRHTINDVIRRGFEKGSPAKTEVRMHLTKGNTGIFSLMSTPLMEDGRVYALSVIGRDITDIRSMQHRLSLQARDLTLMINGLSHELRNPLTVIGAYMRRIEKQEKGRATDFMSEALSGIHTSIQRIEEMIQRIEHYENIVNMRVMHSEVNIRRLVSDVLEDSIEPLDVVIDGDRNLMVFSDQRHIRDAFQRILENAVDTGSERFEINISKRDGYAYVSLRDFGPGIKGDVETLFAPFFSDDPRKIGLGLTEARIAMAKIGSQIEVVPQVNTGAVFTLKILMDRRKSFRED